MRLSFLQRAGFRVLYLCVSMAVIAWSIWGSVAYAAEPFPVTLADQTPTQPLANPAVNSYESRYVSGFGTNDSFTVFFEDRDAASTISYNSTTTGPTGFAASNTATNIADTHFVVKEWPINVGGVDYAYRAWGAVGNNPDHKFYVSNNLSNWTLVSVFTIPNATTFTNAKGWVYYGFHDVILLNGTYYAFAESNQSQTMLVRSANGDEVWEAFASVGGVPGDGPLELPAGISDGWTPTGSFIDLGYDRGCGKVYADPRDSNFYLAINTEAKFSLPPADLEAAFINPANWTWNDLSTGPAANPIMSETPEHDLRECWVVPNTDPAAPWTIIYDADYGSADGGKSLGWIGLTPPEPPFEYFYLPVIFKSHVSGPDLVVNEVVAVGGTVTVTIENIGDAPSVDDFWVDFYVAPSPNPSQVNQTWQMLCTQGEAWGVQASLGPGDMLVLTNRSGGPGYNYYWPTQSNFTSAAGLSVWAQVDAVDFATGYGAVLENHEGSGGPYNNILGGGVGQAGGVAESSQVNQSELRSWGNLPPRL